MRQIGYYWCREFTMAWKVYYWDGDLFHAVDFNRKGQSYCCLPSAVFEINDQRIAEPKREDREDAA